MMTVDLVTTDLQQEFIKLSPLFKYSHLQSFPLISDMVIYYLGSQQKVLLSAEISVLQCVPCMCVFCHAGLVGSVMADEQSLVNYMPDRLKGKNHYLSFDG